MTTCDVMVITNWLQRMHVMACECAQLRQSRCSWRGASCKPLLDSGQSYYANDCQHEVHLTQQQVNDALATQQAELHRGWVWHELDSEPELVAQLSKACIGMQKGAAQLLIHRPAGSHSTSPAQQSGLMYTDSSPGCKTDQSQARQQRLAVQHCIMPEHQLKQATAHSLHTCVMPTFPVTAPQAASSKDDPALVMPPTNVVQYKGWFTLAKLPHPYCMYGAL